MTELSRLVLDFRRGELVLRTLYRSEDDPNTKARRREVSALVREGLQHALEQLRAGDVVLVGTSGFTVREDVLCTDIEGAPVGVHKKLAKGA